MSALSKKHGRQLIRGLTRTGRVRDVQPECGRDVFGIADEAGRVGMVGRGQPVGLAESERSEPNPHIGLCSAIRRQNEAYASELGEPRTGPLRHGRPSVRHSAPGIPRRGIRRGGSDRPTHPGIARAGGRARDGAGHAPPGAARAVGARTGAGRSPGCTGRAEVGELPESRRGPIAIRGLGTPRANVRRRGQRVLVALDRSERPLAQGPRSPRAFRMARSGGPRRRAAARRGGGVRRDGGSPCGARVRPSGLGAPADRGAGHRRGRDSVGQYRRARAGHRTRCTIPHPRTGCSACRS